MTRRLIYVVGPSGAGKDSVLLGLREGWHTQRPAHWARRTVTRPGQAGGEHHESVTRAEFEGLREADSFAMHWEANTLCYGVRHTELAPLANGHCVLVNGSRAYVPSVLRQWPEATVVHITAPADLLLQRLKARRREDRQAISDRLARSLDIELPDDTIRIVNDGALQEAVGVLAAALRVRLAGEPVGVS